MSLVIRIKLTVGDGDIEVWEDFPAKYTVCDDCEGEGSVLSASIREHAYTQEDMQEDPDFFEEYMRGGKGIYGVQCPTCKGRTTVATVDESKCSKRQLRFVRRHEAQEDDRAIDRARDRAIYRMECGGYDC